MKTFLTIKDASRETGLSQFYLRKCVRDGSIKHIKCGEKYLINMPRLLEQLDALESEVTNGRNN